MIVESSQPTDAASTEAALIVPWVHVEKFVGQVSHDLRNGLNACELQLTFLAEIATDPEATEEIKQLRQTLAGITKQLQAIRVATAGAKANLLPYPAADLFEDLRERFDRLQPDNTAKVTWEISVEPALEVLVDPELTITACLEILGNALQFGDKQAPIRCAVGADGSAVVCTVEEALAEAPATDPAGWGCAPLVSTRRGAYGLGLFRARRFLRAQGSRLTFHYASEAQTLTGTVTLPLASEQSPPRP